MISPSFWCRATLLVTFGCAIHTTSADEHAAPLGVQLIIGGTQISEDSSYTHLGALRPSWGGRLGHGWYQSAFVSYLTYDYDTEVQAETINVKARAPGIELGIGYIWDGERHAVNLSLAAGYRNYNLSPDLPSEEPNGDQGTVIPQLQASYRMAPAWDADLISNYAFGPDSTFNRARLGYLPLNGWRFGPELIFQEGRNYRNEQVGFFVAVPLQPGWRLEMSSGRLEKKDGAIMPYMGIAFSKVL